MYLPLKEILPNQMIFHWKENLKQKNSKIMIMEQKRIPIKNLEL